MQFRKPLAFIFVAATLIAIVGCSSTYDDRVDKRGDSLRYAVDNYEDVGN